MPAFSPSLSLSVSLSLSLCLTVSVSVSLTEILAVDGASHGQGVEHRHHPAPAGGSPVVGEAQVVVRTQVEHSLRTAGPPEETCTQQLRFGVVQNNGSCALLTLPCREQEAD